RRARAGPGRRLRHPHRAPALGYRREREMTGSLILAVPSKGRLMEQTSEALAKAGLTLRKTGSNRGYRGEIEGLEGVEVAFVSASEIAHYLKSGQAHLGITGEDLIRETI